MRILVYLDGMPRIGRLHIPGGFYHVMGRGLERRYIFKSLADKQDFLARIGESLDRANAQCLAWALMSNHYHFLIQVSDKPLSGLMASSLGGFASSYNRRHRRVGYVFQNRYKSILIDGDTYFKELVRYIHLNPVRAAMVEDVYKLGRYPWTGHAGMFNRYKQAWHSADETLRYFGTTKKHARAIYLEFIKAGENASQCAEFDGGGLVRSHGGWQGIDRLRREHTVCIGDERVLGSSGFVECALLQDKLAIEHSDLLAREGWDIEKLARSVCRYVGISEGRLVSKARRGSLSDAKGILCFLGVRELGLSMRELATFLSISQPSVSAWVKKGELLCQQNDISLKSIGR